MFRGEWQIDGDGVSGWAEAGASGEPVWVELLVNGESMGIAHASLEAGRGGGFWVGLPPVALEEEADIQVRVANTDIFLDQKDARLEEAKPLISEFQLDRGLMISGWALDSAHSDEKLEIRVIYDDRIIASTIAGERRYRPLIGDGHGFSLELPSYLADGASHVISLQDDKGRNLQGSPIRVRSLPKKASQWLADQGRPEKQTVKMVAGLLEAMEERLPGLVTQARYEDWKKAFPVSPPAQRQKAAISILGDAGLLKNQQGIDLRPGGTKPDFYLSPGQAKGLHPYALARMVAEMRKGAALVYADGESGAPLFKPAWDREAFFAQDYLGPFLVTPEVAQAAGIAAGEPDMSLRLRLALAAESLGQIRHLPAPLSQHECAGSPARSQALGRWLAQNLPGASWDEGRVRYSLSARPRVSIIIPTRDHADLLAVCLRSLRQTDWPDYEIVIVDNGSVEEDALTLLKEAEREERVCILRSPGVFNYAHLNNEAALRATGEYLCFLNNDTEALHPEWLAELAAILFQAGEAGGCAGAKLLWPNGLVQHGGVIVGVNQLAAHVGNQWLADEPGYMNRNQFAQQYSAVTAACMLTSRKLFLDSGGYDERRFPVAFNDVDYCLRLASAGKKIFWTPHSRLTHHESASRGRDIQLSARKRSEREAAMFRLAWGYYEDRFYNPNLPLSSASEPFMGLAFPPRPGLAR
ncbi:MAG: glycosyltransferase [Desulfovibrio sp.]|nr:glycosyltransferase [Desulfovibrio sp.]